MGEAILGSGRIGSFKSIVTKTNGGSNHGWYLWIGDINMTLCNDRILGGHLVFSSKETGLTYGILNIFIQASNSIDSADMKWITLVNPKFKDAIYLTRDTNDSTTAHLWIRQPEASYNDHLEIIPIFGKSCSSVVQLDDGGTWSNAYSGSVICTSYVPDIITLGATNLQSSKEGSLVIGTEAEVLNEYIDETGEQLIGGSGSGFTNSYVYTTNNICYAKRSVVEGIGNVAYGMTGSLCVPYMGACHVEGVSNTTYGNAAHAAGYGNIAYTGQFVIGCFANNDTYYVQNPSNTTIPSIDQSTEINLFIVGNGSGHLHYDTDPDQSSFLEANSRSNAFRVTSKGKVYGAQSYTTGADYAEFFEWEDGNTDNEDRRGLFVTLDGEKIRTANSNDTYILGVVSAAAGVIGDAKDDEWQGKYVQDIYGNRCTETVIVPEVRDENGNIISDGGITQGYIINPDYDPDEVYIPRSSRSEWDPIGLLGKLVVRDDGTCEVGKFCKPNDDGVATLSDTPGYYVMSRLDESHVKILVK